MSFSENLQFLRARAGMTQEQLADELNVSRQSVSKWESGASFPEMETLLRICERYDANLDTLLRGSIQESQVADTARYDDTMNRFSHRVAFSVGAIIAGLALMLLLSVFGIPDILGAFLFLLIIAVSVVVLVANGIQHENFRKKYPVLANFYTQEEKDGFRQKFVWLIAGGVGAILFDVAFLLLFFFFFPEENEFYQRLGIGVFLLIIAGAVTVFVYGGIQMDKYKIWKYNRDNNPTPEAKKRLALNGAICGCIMVLAAAVFVGLGLALGIWRTAVWVFPVGGILCGVSSIILNPYKGED